MTAELTRAGLNRRVRDLLSGALRKQPVVAIVGLSGYPVDDAVTKGIATLEEQGCEVRNFYDPSGKFQRFAATDEQRVAQLHAAATDPQVDIVLALRGGYGLTRLLPLLDFQLLAASGKLFVGHSDFTVLNMALLKHGARSVAGPMLSPDFIADNLSAPTIDSFWQCMLDSTQTVSVEAVGNPAIDVSGTLWGGNLAMLTHLVGSPYLPDIGGGILFVEDISEHPYRVERMLLQLAHAGILARQQALILGDFSGYKLSDYDNGYDFSQMVAYLRRHLPIPVLTGLPFGHCRDKVTLPVGAKARLTTTVDTLDLTITDYPTLPTSA